VVSAFQALAFTGATPYTSPSGVRKEIRLALPPLAAGAAAAFAAWAVFLLSRGAPAWLP
jgi:acetyl-CoA decarbonylase/synthase complex subunit gamma